MKKLFSLLTALFLVVFFVSAQVSVQNLLTENLINPIGIDAIQPRFSWQLISDKKNISQTAYEIKVSSNAGGNGDAWNSGKNKFGSVSASLL